MKTKRINFIYREFTSVISGMKGQAFQATQFKRLMDLWNDLRQPNVKMHLMGDFNLDITRIGDTTYTNKEMLDNLLDYSV